MRELILSARQTVARGVNATLTMLYWQIGDHVRKDILQEKRAGYGEKIVVSLARQLESEFGRGFTKRNLDNMIRFAEAFSNSQIVHALSAQLSVNNVGGVEFGHKAVGAYSGKRSIVHLVFPEGDPSSSPGLLYSATLGNPAASSPTPTGLWAKPPFVHDLADQIVSNRYRLAGC